LDENFSKCWKKCLDALDAAVADPEARNRCPCLRINDGMPLPDCFVFTKTGLDFRSDVSESVE
jgi:hypothetical protein